MKIERIIWIDSNHLSGWHNPKDADYKPMKCESYGRVISEGDDYVTVACSWESDDQVSDAMTIPKVAIWDRVELIAKEAADG